MVNFVSPGVYVIEKDNSEFPISINSSVVGLVGFASKGPPNKATLITSQENLVKTFGRPSENIYGQGLEGAIEILETTNQVYYVRAMTTSGADASAAVTMGSCPAIQVSSNAYGVTSGLWLEVQVTNNAGVNQFITRKRYAIPSGTVDTVTGTQGQALKQILGGSLDSAKFGAFFDGASETSGYIVGGWAGSGATLSVSAYQDSAYTNGTSALVALTTSGDASAGQNLSSMTVSGITFETTGANSFVYLVESLYEGAGYNAGTRADGTTSGNSVEITSFGNENFLLTVNDEGVATEQFKTSLVASGDFIEDLINTGEVDPTSEFIKGNIAEDNTDINVTALNNFVLKLSALGTTINRNGSHGGQAVAAVNPRFVKPVAGTYNLTNGNNGDPGAGADADDAVIGDATVDPKTGMQALDDDLLNISIAAIPGITSQNVQNNLITLAEASQNFIALVAPPFGVGNVQNANDWANGQSDTRTAALNNSYGAVYWPWVKTFNTFDGKDIWYDPTIFAARQMAFTDEVAETWFAPAGFIRGRLTKPTEVEVNLNQGDRDSLYSGGNIINPVVNFPQQGITIFGQRTSQRSPTALDRVNVRRLMIVLRKILLGSTRRFVFEPNDATTWEKIENFLNPLVDDIRRRRGITDFKIVCDETTNTPIRVDRNELWCKILIRPTKAAEIVVFELNLTNQSAQIS